MGLISRDIPYMEIKKISRGLEYKTKENYLAKNKREQNKLTKVYKSLLIGLYTKEIKEK